MFNNIAYEYELSLSDGKAKLVNLLGEPSFDSTNSSVIVGCSWMLAGGLGFGVACIDEM